MRKSFHSFSPSGPCILTADEVADPTGLTVRLWVDDDLHIEVVDDGVGLPAVTNGGVGLRSMRERATELGGECLIEADHDGGTRVFATLPLPKEGG